MDTVQIKKLSQLGVVWETAMNTFAGHEEVYYNLIKKLPADEYFEILQKEIKNKNYEEAFKAAHTLKGICSNLGIKILLEQLNPLVELLRREPYATEIIGVYMNRLHSKYTKAMEIIGEL